MNVIDQIITDKYAVYHGDCVEVMRGIPSDSIHYEVFSPPFEGLYVYSNSERDMGNSKDGHEFREHYKYLIKEQFRTTMPGRLISIHCMDIPLMKERDGVIGLKDFPAQLRQMYEDAGFIYHSKVTIWKDPLIEAVRTKALGLMHKQLTKDSAMCRQGLPDYLLTMRKPGINPEPIAHPDGLTSFAGTDEPNVPKKKPDLTDSRIHKDKSLHNDDPVYSHHVWRRYASPVWMDINQTNTLQHRSARDDKDERHIAPLQLDVIERAIQLWSNPGDTVLSPFGGIGSEGYMAVKMGRKSVSIELKPSYYAQNVRNHEAAANEAEQPNLF
ncbi:MAG: DNA methyltransferase [Candidatus Cohnella colombiensis]|uniref:Methyltransferase n=1 Tax=Candidatus Cohnella colombiensis TaxID=3121368 RepID=A0AA95EU57_9BACL|nr:MAG: DNA methyltransferase [Cohnella sp.]